MHIMALIYQSCVETVQIWVQESWYDARVVHENFIYVAAETWLPLTCFTQKYSLPKHWEEKTRERNKTFSSLRWTLNRDALLESIETGVKSPSRGHRAALCEIWVAQTLTFTLINPRAFHENGCAQFSFCRLATGVVRVSFYSLRLCSSKASNLDNSFKFQEILSSKCTYPAGELHLLISCLGRFTTWVCLIRNRGTHFQAVNK